MSAMVETYRSARGDTVVSDLDGVSWHAAPKPHPFHRCWVQTQGWIGLSRVERCACGAIRSREGQPWQERNSRS